ncbi:MAG TPA: hypothetical protein VLV16_14835 [Gemmatimonadales bacterium]|nr:hypothetical protein [Gemmatimonadales bacterium]
MTGRALRTVVGIAVATAASGTVVAQQHATTRIDSGKVVRIHLMTKASVDGRLVEAFMPASSQLIFCRYPGTPCASATDPHVRTIGVGEVARLEVAQGNHLFKGAVIGTLIGAAVAGSLALVASGACEEDCAEGRERFILSTVGLGLGLGILFGWQSSVWKPAP